MPSREIPDTLTGDAVTVDAQMVRERLSSVAQDRDLSQYIL